MAIKSPLGRQLGTQFDSVFDVVKSNPMYDKAGGKIPSLDLNFAKSKSLRDSRSTKNLINFTRASSGTYVGSDGLIKTTPVNLLPYSDYSLNAGTTDAQLEGVVAAPDGTITARRYSVPSAGLDTINKIIYDDIAGKNYTFSVWVRSTGTTSEVRLIVGNHAINAIVQISTQWQRFEVTKINNSGTLVRSYVQMLNVGDEIEVWGSQLEEGTTATDYIPTGATISGAPRFDHDPVTGESLGLLIEESRTNSITASVPQDTAPWSPRVDTTCTLNAATAPDGTLTATKVSADVGNTSYAWNRYSLGAAITGSSVFSIYAKDSGEGGCTIAVNNTSGLSIYTFNFTTKNGVLGGGDGSNPQTLELPNGWFKFSFSIGPGLYRITLNARSILYAFNNPVGNGVNGVLFWGVQVEEGSFPTSYIPTAGSTVTRSPDIASIEGTNFSSWYNDNEGTWFTDMSLGFTQNAGNPYIFGGVYYTTVNGDVRTLGNQTLLIGLSTSLTVPSKTALGMKPGDYKLYRDGTQPAGNTSTSSYVPAGTELQLTPELGGMGRIARLAYFPTRLSDDKLKSITT